MAPPAPQRTVLGGGLVLHVRDGLLLAIRQQCVAPNAFRRRFDYPDLDALAIAAIKALPDQFPRRTI